MKTVVKVMPERWAEFITTETDSDGGLDKGEIYFVRDYISSLCPEGHYFDRVENIEWTPGSRRFTFIYKPF